MTGLATKQLLESLGHNVEYDRRQTCCGQAPFNAGFRAEAKSLAERFIRIFADADVVVAPSGSCVSMVKHHYGELGFTGELLRTWEAFTPRVWELSSFLIDNLKLTKLDAEFPHKVVYHGSCHLESDLGVIDQPRQLLKMVRNIELVEPEARQECCGFGGVFSAKYTDLSHAISDRRAKALIATGAEYVTGADDSCLNNIHNALRRAHSSMQTIHIAQILTSKVEVTS